MPKNRSTWCDVEALYGRAGGASQFACAALISKDRDRIEQRLRAEMEEARAAWCAAHIAFNRLAGLSGSGDASPDVRRAADRRYAALHEYRRVLARFNAFLLNRARPAEPENR